MQVYARVAGNGCPTCCPIGSSYGEQGVLTALQILEPQTRHRARLTNPDGRDVEVDAIAGDLAVEFNGLYWHSEAGGRDRTSHAKKMAAIRQAGLSPMTVWEDEWNDLAKRAVLVRMMAHRIGRLDRLHDALHAVGAADRFDPIFTQRLGARSLRPARITSAEASAFLRDNHIQGAVVLTCTSLCSTTTTAPALCSGCAHPGTMLGRSELPVAGTSSDTPPQG